MVLFTKENIALKLENKRLLRWKNNEAIKIKHKGTSQTGYERKRLTRITSEVSSESRTQSEDGIQDRVLL